jgi:hypothetical protein
MSAVEFGHFALTIVTVLAAGRGLGYIAGQLMKPRIV